MSEEETKVEGEDMAVEETADVAPESTEEVTPEVAPTEEAVA